MAESFAALSDHVAQQMVWKFSNRSTDHAMLLLDARGRVLWANIGAEHILGIAPESVVGQLFNRFFTEGDVQQGIPEHELEVATQTGSASDDRWMVRADASRFWAAGMTVFLGDEEDCRFLKILRDMTELKMHLEGARKKGRAAKEVREDSEAAIALLAHELRNPLAGITLGADIVRMTAGDNAKAMKGVESISSSARHADRLIEDLMQHSKVNSEGYQLEPSSCTLAALLDESSSIARTQMGQPDRPVKLILPPREIEMQVDQMRMRQVFVNLIANSIRYTPAPRRIWVTGTTEGQDVVVRFSDEGVGMESSKLDHLFEAFTGARVKGTKLGLGLGLALVKKIVELHGGSVQAKSEGANKGSQFVVRFPSVQ